MSSKRYCLQKELSWGICNLFGSSDTPGAGQRTSFMCQVKGDSATWWQELWDRLE